jgi:hypothetical protein
METQNIKASKSAVLFPDELDIMEVVGERFHADNWFKYVSDELRKSHQPP